MKSIDKSTVPGVDYFLLDKEGRRTQGFTTGEIHHKFCSKVIEVIEHTEGEYSLKLCDKCRQQCSMIISIKHQEGKSS